MDYKRLCLFVVALISSIYLGWRYAGDFARCDKGPEILINIFSILMSVMLAVMTLSADFRKSVSNTANQINYLDKLSSLTRLIFLFSVYVMVLVGSFILVVLGEHKSIVLSGIVLGSASFAMMMSVKMPFAIYATLKSADPDIEDNK